MAERNPWVRMEPATPLEVSMVDARQAWVRGQSEGDNWDDRYVAFSGYYGSYGPHVFAAAPDLLEALKMLDAVGVINPTGSRKVESAVTKMRAAIAKAEGRS